MRLYDLVKIQDPSSLIDSYEFQCYQTTIRKNSTSSIVEYSVNYNKKVLRELTNFNAYERQLKDVIKEFILNSEDFVTLDCLISFVSNIEDKFSDISISLRIAVLLRILNMERIGPLLIDDQIDEIYLDSSQSYVYIDHVQYGRCSTQIRLNKQEIDSFISRITLENDFNLNRENPTMKGELITKLFHTRITIDIPPLLVDDIHLDIRKFHPNNLQLRDLVKIGSLTKIQGKFLKEMIKNLISISIIGPPNSGKTTLQNALIEYLPSHFRLLSVEDVLESTNLRKGNQIRFRLGYDPKDTRTYSKAMEIQKLLHRSPDYVNLGELSTESNFIAFLNVLSVGIPSIQTIHGRDPNYLLLRLQDIYKIPVSLIKTSFPHIFIEMDTIWNKSFRNRFVVRIAELTTEGTIVILSDRERDDTGNIGINKDNSTSLEFLEYRKHESLGHYD